MHQLYRLNYQNLADIIVKWDFYTFKSEFQKFVEPIVQKKYLADYLKINCLTGSALTLVEKENEYLVGPYYAGSNSTRTIFTPALITPRANFDLPPFRAAFNATIGKIRKKARFLIYNNSYFLFNCFQCFF